MKKLSDWYFCAFAILFCLSNSLLQAAPKLWGPDGVTVYHNMEMNYTGVTVPSDTGGMFVVWGDCRTGSYDLYGQFIAADGHVMWNDSGVPIVSHSGLQKYPTAAAVNQGWIVAWVDYRDHALQFPRQAIDRQKIPYYESRERGGEAWVQKLDGSGKPARLDSDISGERVSDSDWSPKPPINVVDDGRGGAYVIWTEQQAQYSRLMAQWIDAEGNLMWQWPLNISGDDSSTDIFSTAVRTDGGAVMVLWCAAGDTTRQIMHVSKVNVDATVSVGPNGGEFAIPTRIEYLDMHSCEDGSGGALVWMTKRGSSEKTRVWMQRVNSEGNPIWCSNGTGLIFSDARAFAMVAPSRISEQCDGLILGWSDLNPANQLRTVRAQKISMTGTALWSDSAVVVTTFKEQQYPASWIYLSNVVSDKKGGALLIWSKNYRQDKDILRFTDNRVSSVDVQGRLLWGADGVSIASEQNLLRDVELAPDSAGVLGTYFLQDDRAPRLRAFRLEREDGRVAPFSGENVFSFTNSKGRTPKLVSLGQDRVGLAWQEYGWDGYTGLSYQILDENGQRLFPMAGKLLRSKGSENHPLFPEFSVCEDGFGGAFIQTVANSGPDEGILFQNHIYPDGKDPGYEKSTHSFVFSGVTSPLPMPIVRPDGTGGCYAIASESRWGNLPSTIRMYRLDPIRYKSWGPATVEERHALIHLLDAVTTRDSSLMAFWEESSATNKNELHAASVAAWNYGRWFKVLHSGWDSYDVRVVSDGNYGAYFAWSARRGDNPIQYSGWKLQHIDSMGTLMWGDSGVALEIGSAKYHDFSFEAMTSDSAGSLYVLTEGFQQLRVEKFSPNGKRIWRPEGMSMRSILPPDSFYSAMYARMSGAQPTDSDSIRANYESEMFASMQLTAFRTVFPDSIRAQGPINEKQFLPDQHGGCFITCRIVRNDKSQLVAVHIDSLFDENSGFPQLTVIADITTSEEYCATRTTPGDFIVLWNENRMSEPGISVWKAQRIRNEARMPHPDRK
jgi:hypothetical protein